FKLAYSVSGSSYYEGKRLGTVNKKSYGVSQWGRLSGETPYGDMFATGSFSGFKEDTHVDTYTLGLTKAHIGNFKDFNISGFDVSKSFSDFTLPSSGVRGVILDGRGFNNKLRYDFLWGKEREVFGYLAPGIVEEKETFLEGGKLSFYPSKRNRYSINFVRGYGSAREDYLRDNVFSWESGFNLDNVNISSEIASDGYSTAGFINSEFRKEDLALRINFRNIEKNFTTITGWPSDRGEIGSLFGLNYKLGGIDISSQLDIYRDRYLYNLGKPRSLNYDWDTDINFPLDKNSNFNTSFSYINNPGLLSPRKSFRVSNRYNRGFKILGDKRLSIYVGNSYQVNKFPLSPSSEYSSFGLNSGFSMYPIKNLGLYTNYDYSWVEDLYTGNMFHPGVWTLGMNYNKQLSPLFSISLNSSYRDEERTEGERSFLAGEDVLTYGLSLNCTPTKDLEFYIDSRLNNIWAENPQREAYNDLYISWGMRSLWDLPLRWGPSCKIKGIIFKDTNGNGKKDENEEGIAGVKVNVGSKKVVTNAKGEYVCGVKAKKVIVSIDPLTLPKGYVFSTTSYKELEVIQGKTIIADFGLTTKSGIYGVVFYDMNGNGIPDLGDTFISRAKIILDNKNTTLTDFEGSYFFRNVEAGKHTIILDVNSLPIEYLPSIKIRNEIELQEGTTYIFHIPLRKKS
ncbi:MAG: MSCRAMM family adhesin SdrC, partial [Candidatus Omnitrophica bacterium]|nr:MSCRAMM family adhesin SdrC [Candidatus Omnitrophota bacterium]